MQELRLLAVDLETTGLDPQVHEVLSLGLVPVDGLTIDLSGARQYAVRPTGAAGVGHSATVHGITDDEAAAAVPLSEVLPEVVAALEGRVLLAHFATLETGFLTAACRRAGLAVPDLVAVDTLELQRRILRRSRLHHHSSRGELTLSASRHHHGLPRYRSHDALTDALACAELYLAQVAALGENLTVRQLLR
ncbi:exonuclease domain-containing protein [Ornithinimicrobium ciconiae]|uniref:exonuclease domain-containing protein n=1 Tax=Ornithinimicrobium ciconiae TaxID=2594265 RepID=UPI001D19138F|nr:exonuclease domain-containing protein [Ornithinimicrobium ciconiae]